MISRICMFMLSLRRPVMAASLSLCILAACGGDGANDPAGPPSASWSAADATAMLTSSPKRYPAALAVHVTSGTTDVQVRGSVQRGGAPLKDDAAFPVGSLTKSMTATLAGVLVQENRISLSSRVFEVLPELARIGRAEYAQVTLSDLLSHRGGVFAATTPEEIAQLPALSGSSTAQRLQFAQWALRRAPLSTPGSATDYSNGGYVIAAAMLERAAGQPFDTLLQVKVFGPLGASVQFGAPGAALGEPWGHSVRAGTMFAPVQPDSPDAQFPAFAYPAGGAKLSGASLARYLQMHLRAQRGQQTQVLSPAMARLLHTPIAQGFGLGWQGGNDLLGRSLAFHDGSDDFSYYALMALSLTSDSASAVVTTGYSPQVAEDVSETTARLLR